MTERKAAFSFEVPTEADPIPLELNGEVVAECVPMLDGLVILEFLANSRNRDIPASKRAAAISKFLRQCLVTTRIETKAAEDGSTTEVEVEDETEYKKFRRAADRLQLRIEDVASVAGYLADVYADRPTKSAQPSTAGRSTTGSSSEGSSSSED